MTIKTIEEAIEILKKRYFDVEDISQFKWRVSDDEFKEEMETDEELIFFAEEQKMELEDE